MTIDVASRRSLLVDSSGLIRRLSFIATRALLRSFIVFILTFLDRPATVDFSDWDAASKDGFEWQDTPDDEWAEDEVDIFWAFLPEELTAVVFEFVGSDPISVDDGAKWPPSFPVSLSESRLMMLKGLLSVVAEALTMLIGRGVTAVEDEFASLIGIGTTVGGWGWLMLLSREGWKAFLPLAEAFGWISWKCGQYCQPVFWRPEMKLFLGLFCSYGHESGKNSELVEMYIPWLHLYQMRPPNTTQTLFCPHLLKYLRLSHCPNASLTCDLCSWW